MSYQSVSNAQNKHLYAPLVHVLPLDTKSLSRIWLPFEMQGSKIEGLKLKVQPW
jgi:hypothetical protein